MSAASMAKKGLSTMSFSNASQHAAVRCFTCCAKEEWDVSRNLCIPLLHTPSMLLNTITGLWTKPLSNASHHAAVRCFTCCAKEEWDVSRNLCISLLHTPSMQLNTTTGLWTRPLSFVSYQTSDYHQSFVNFRLSLGNAAYTILPEIHTHPGTWSLTTILVKRCCYGYLPLQHTIQRTSGSDDSSPIYKKVRVKRICLKIFRRHSR